MAKSKPIHPEEQYLRRIKELALIGIVSNDRLMNTLVLKGGNALDLVYKIGSRYSLDLDFSMAGSFEPDLEKIRDQIEVALKKTFQPEGYFVFDVEMTEKPPHLSPDVADFWGGYDIEFKVIRHSLAQQLNFNLEQIRRQALTVGDRQRKRFEIQISKHEYCGLRQEVELEGYTLYVYPLAVLVMEKLRALCQQMPEYAEIVHKHRAARARDFFDIHAILTHFQVDLATPENLDALRKVFEAKRVPMQLIRKISETREDHRTDFTSVKATTPRSEQMKTYDEYFDFVVSITNRLCHLLGIE